VNIPIRIPRWLVHTWQWLVEWGDVCVWWRVLRIDIAMLALFLVCSGWYGYYYGIMGALQGGVMFIAIAALALFVRR
jgi:hypothetical protein